MPFSLPYPCYRANIGNNIFGWYTLSQPPHFSLSQYAKFAEIHALLLIALLLLAFTGQAQPGRVRQTDSSRIETQIYPGGREEKEVLRRKDIVYWRFYRDNTPQVTTTGTLTKAGLHVGLWTDYDNQGKLLYVIDCDRGTWRVANLKAYPFFPLQRHLKAQADSLIVATYGRAFLRTHAVWNVQSSAIYNAQEAGSWTGRFTTPPTRFLFRYNVKLDPQHIYPDLLEFELDAQGRFLPNSTEEVFGFEQRPSHSISVFTLRYEQALRLVKRISNTRRPLVGFLQWEGLQQARFYNGHFRFYVPLLTSSSKDLHPEGRSEVIDHFNVYVFDPWTGGLLGKRKMKNVHGWEALSGSSSGLLPE